MTNAVYFKYELGSELKDRVTGFKGICDQRVEMLNGCLRYSITGTVNKTGEYQGYWVDEEQLEFMNDGLNKTKPVKKTKTGGAVTKSQSITRSH